MPISREAYRGTYRAEDLARVHALVGNPRFQALLKKHGA